MTMQQAVILILQSSILLTVFGFGLQTTLHDLQYILRRPGLLGRSLLSMFVVMPVVALILVRTFELPLSFKMAMVALAISPVPPLLPNKEGKAGGRAGYALGLMAVVSVLAIAVVPVWLVLLGSYADRELQMSPWAIAKVVIVMTLLPLAAGVLVRTLAPSIAERAAKPLSLVATVLLFAGAGVLLIAALPMIARVIDGQILLALALFVAAGLAAGHWLGGPHAEESSVLALSTASRHPAIALAVAKANFPNEPTLGAMVLLYLVVLTVLTLPYVKRQGARATPTPQPQPHA